MSTGSELPLATTCSRVAVISGYFINNSDSPSPATTQPISMKPRRLVAGGVAGVHYLAFACGQQSFRKRMYGGSSSNLQLYGSLRSV